MSLDLKPISQLKNGVDGLVVAGMVEVGDGVDIAEVIVAGAVMDGISGIAGIVVDGVVAAGVAVVGGVAEELEESVAVFPSMQQPSKIPIIAPPGNAMHAPVFPEKLHVVPTPAQQPRPPHPVAVATSPKETTLLRTHADLELWNTFRKLPEDEDVIV